MPTAVTETPPAHSEAVLARYAHRLAFETDCADVQEAMLKRASDFVLLDVRSPQHYARAHIPGAINLLRGKMTARRMAEWPAGTLFVVYCAGPQCNGADRAAVQLATLGLPVKLMIGGATGWADEGYDFAAVKTPVAPRQPSSIDLDGAHSTTSAPAEA